MIKAMHQHNKLKDHNNKAVGLETSSKIPKSLGLGNILENVMIIDKENNHSL